MLIAVSFVVTDPSFATAPAAECTGVAVLDPNGTVRGYAGGDAEVELFRLDLPSPGIATFDVMTPRVEENPVKLDLLRTGCGQASPGDATTPLRLGRRVAGEIDNAWDDDPDVFALTLNGVTTVEVTVGGAAGVSAALHGRSGQRLAADRGDPDDRLVATLGPGRYYVRVEGGDAAAGAYELTVTARPW